jgi:hypothetical protein
MYLVILNKSLCIHRTVSNAIKAIIKIRFNFALFGYFAICMPKKLRKKIRTFEMLFAALVLA